MLLCRCFKTFVSGIGAQSKYYKIDTGIKKTSGDMKQSQSGLFPGFFCVRMHLTILNTQKFLINI